MLGKISLDPNNLAWANDTEKFGYRMMMKMGWAPGKGLGVNEDGIVKNLPMTKKVDRTGIGTTSALAGWLDANKEYVEVLNSLNVSITSNKSAANNSNSVDNNSNSATEQKSHRHYIPGKVVRGKSVSAYSKADLSAIFGVTENSSSSSKDVTEVITKPSTLNMKDYFSQKISNINVTEVKNASSPIPSTEANQTKDEEKTDNLPSQDDTKSEQNRDSKDKKRKRSSKDKSSKPDAEDKRSKKRSKKKKKKV